MLENGAIDNDTEKEKLEYLLRTKKWNPYCLRHSAITNDSDYLPEFAVKKKTRWSMNSRQGTRYIKSRMGADLKRTILLRNGITVEDDEALKPKPAVRDCPRCNLVNTFDNKYCSKCSYPLIPEAFDEIKASEAMKLKAVEERYQLEMKAMKEDLKEEMKKQIAQVIIRLKPEIVREGLT
jgi:integrase/recombinase XerD